MSYQDDQDEVKSFIIKNILAIIAGAIFCLIFLIGITWGVLALSQEYKVWSASKDGEAQLAEADYSRQISVREATAKKDSAIMLAQAEVERAKGVAQANQIIGQSLRQNEDYLRYLWITDVASNQQGKTVVYVPTESNLPILEANRLGK